MFSGLIRSFSRSFSSSSSSSSSSFSIPASFTTPAVLPQLNYSYNSLEPAISGQIMETHHTKHHQAYVTNLNNGLKQLQEAEQKGDLQKQIQLQPMIRFNGGGHINHSIFWTNLAPKNQGGGELPDKNSEINKYIIKDFGSWDNFKSVLNNGCIGIQGSGWGWLGYNKQFDRVEFLTRVNQDPLVEAGLTPLLGVDVWEHAYYYLYGPQRAKYLEALWTIFNWRNVEQRLQQAKK